MYVNNLLKASNARFSEPEVAQMLGLSIEQLRSLVRDHIVKGEDVESPAMETYQQTDVVLLRILAHRPVRATASV